jgi:peptide/nickel transport system substrate-binding protein
VKGDLAESWKVSPDGLTYEFKLRPNVKFHDGTSLTSNDVKVSYERLRNPPPGVISMHKVMFEDVKSIEAPDESTVVFRMSGPNSAMLQLIGMPFACVYSAKLLAEDTSYPSKKVMGTGPFRFTRYSPGQEWVGERFDGYFKPGQPYLDGFRALSIVGTAATNAVIAGQVAFNMRGLTPSEIDRVKAARGDKVKIVGRQTATGVHTWLAVNSARAPLNDARVRRALTLALDRWMGTKAMEPLTSIHLMGGLYRPGSPLARSPKELEKLPGFGRDINAARVEARRLLAEAGVTNLKLVFVNSDPYPFYGVYVLDQLRQIGVTVEHHIVAPPTFVARRAAGDFDLALANPLEYMDDPTVQMSSLLPFKDNPSNYTRSNDSRLAALFVAQKRALDLPTRRQRAQELEEYVLNQSYVIPLFWQNWARAISSDVGGLDDMPSNFLKLDLADLWMRTGGK